MLRQITLAFLSTVEAVEAVQKCRSLGLGFESMGSTVHVLIREPLDLVNAVTLLTELAAYAHGNLESKDPGYTPIADGTYKVEFNGDLPYLVAVSEDRGYWVSLAGYGYAVAQNNDDTMLKGIVRNYALKHRERLTGKDHAFLGIWRNPTSKLVEFDVSVWVADKADALTIATSIGNNQSSIWDCANDTALDVSAEMARI